jgi:hypothetical protein
VLGAGNSKKRGAKSKEVRAQSEEEKERRNDKRANTKTGRKKSTEMKMGDRETEGEEGAEGLGLVH